MAKAPVTEAKFELDPIDLQDMQVTIVGDTPLIVHAWSEKAKRLMLEKQTKAASRGREAKAEAIYDATERAPKAKKRA